MLTVLTALSLLLLLGKNQPNGNCRQQQMRWRGACTKPFQDSKDANTALRGSGKNLGCLRTFVVTLTPSRLVIFHCPNTDLREPFEVSEAMRVMTTGTGDADDSTFRQLMSTNKRHRNIALGLAWSHRCGKRRCRAGG